MRDPNRIDPMLAKLGVIWKANPEWRLGQLICNIATQPSIMMDSFGRLDPFYVEDENMEDFMDKMLKEMLGEDSKKKQTPPTPQSDLDLIMAFVDEHLHTVKPMAKMMFKALQDRLRD